MQWLISAYCFFFLSPPPPPQKKKKKNDSLMIRYKMFSFSSEKSGELTVAVARRASPENVELEARQSLSTPTTDNPGGNGFTGFDAVYANRCGYGRWRPDCLQALNRPGVLVAFLASYSFVLGKCCFFLHR